MTKRKLLTLALTVAMIAILALGGSLAYFTANDSAVNTFTVGNVAIDLTEPNWDATGMAEAENAYPGEPLAKDPTVTNTGINPCFVRVSVTGLDQFAADFDGAMITYRTDYVEGALGTDWVKSGEYYYYTKVLAAGATTDALFDQIVIPFEVTNSTVTSSINVYAEAVQAQGAKPSFSAVQAMTVEEIAAWFATCGL